MFIAQLLKQAFSVWPEYSNEDFLGNGIFECAYRFDSNFYDVALL